jgi:hypothetical protein
MSCTCASVRARYRRQGELFWGRSKMLAELRATQPLPEHKDWRCQFLVVSRKDLSAVGERESTRR